MTDTDSADGVRRTRTRSRTRPNPTEPDTPRRGAPDDGAPDGGAPADSAPDSAEPSTPSRRRTRPAASADAGREDGLQDAGDAAGAAEKPAAKKNAPARKAPAKKAPTDSPRAKRAPAKKAPSTKAAAGKRRTAASSAAQAMPPDEPTADEPAASPAGEAAEPVMTQPEAAAPDPGGPAEGGQVPRARSRARSRTRRTEAAEAELADGDDGDAQAGEPGSDAAAPQEPQESQAVHASPDDQTSEDALDEDAEAAPAARSGSRRRRGRRGRGRRRAGTGSQEAGELTDEHGDETGEAGQGDGDPSTEASAAEAPPTRLQARRARAKSRTGPARTGRGRRPVGAVSEETRRAIAESPPRRMLVTVGQERTQLAVLEDRTLVEHYVTRREDVSYVGNIYMGRVQNVLPGMEAAFVDVGKGRNGVLYAGEVDFDPADADGGVPRIEETLKQGQTVLVQVTKDPMGTKGARLTQQLSIAGRYCVLAPGDGLLGISRKLPDDERERLRKLLKVIKPDDYGLIVRTAAEGATKEQLEADVARLVRIWEQVRARAAAAKALEPVYEEPGLVIRVIRDVFGPEYTDLIVDSPVLAEQIRSYLSDVSPELVDRVSVAELPPGPESQPQELFDSYEVTNQIRRALEKKVWLPSGGYLIIEKTEAMWVIDVNTGKFVGKSNLEETVLRNNLEAADEIARQLRLRDMGGIIVIDFVDMIVPANREEVLKRFRRELARDKTKSRVMEISKLGLVQMTRKNVSQGLQESFTTRCDVCEGRGARIVDRIV